MGANVYAQNDNGSTPLHLAVQNTGRGGTGVPAIIARQSEVIDLLLNYGASVTAKDNNGKTAVDAARNPRIQKRLTTKGRS
jgi:ankyrin repeat protein